MSVVILKYLNFWRHSLNHFQDFWLMDSKFAFNENLITIFTKKRKKIST
jgi:hypothetical protein